jgi:hypothetical protein
MTSIFKAVFRRPVFRQRSRLDASRLAGSRGLWADRGGAAIPEFAMACMPVFLIFFGMVQWSIIAYVHLIVKHAAFIAARCDAVVHPAMPDAGKSSDCETKAMEALFKHVSGIETGDVKVSENNAADRSQAMDTVTIKLDYKCAVPLGNNVACGRDHRMKLEEKASFPNQGSAYQKTWGI